MLLSFGGEYRAVLALIVAPVLLPGCAGEPGCVTLDQSDPRVVAEVAVIEGVWAVTHESICGKELEATHRVICESNNVTFVVGDGVKERYQFRVDPREVPKHIDVFDVFVEGSTRMGIYLLQGEELTIAFGEPGERRPCVIGQGGERTSWMLQLKRWHE